MAHDLLPGELGWYAAALASENKTARPLKRWLFRRRISFSALPTSQRCRSAKTARTLEALL